MSTSTEKSKNGIIIILAIALVAAVGYCIYLKSNEPASVNLIQGNAGTTGDLAPHIRFDNWREPVEDNAAIGAMTCYRSHKGRNDANLVIYDSADIANYFGCVWPTLTHAAPPANFRWAVGFYFVRKYDSTKKDSVLDFYVTPTLVTGPIGKVTQVRDFFTEFANTAIYQHDPKYPCATMQPMTGGSGSDTGNSYDAGQLWP